MGLGRDQALAQRACFACHSDETTLPWFDRVAPVSWYVANHVNEGRDVLNFSEWDQPNANFEEVEETIEGDAMPFRDYMLMHPEAQLTSAEKTVLVAGLAKTYRQDPPIPQPRRGRAEE